MAGSSLSARVNRRRLSLDAPLVRFIVVGGINTAVDVAVYTALVAASLPVVPANLVSTSCGLVVSFLLNRRFVFRASGERTGRGLLKQVGGFLLVTGIGLWVLQPLIILAVAALLTGTAITGLLLILAPKIAATCVTLVWNYCFYSMFVFAGARRAPGE